MGREEGIRPVFTPTNCRSVWLAPNGGAIVYRGDEPRIVEAAFADLDAALAWLGEQVWETADPNRVS